MVELINKYRPQEFSEVVGHEAQVRALEATLKKGTARTFLLSGPSGTGKTTLARLSAAALGEHELIEVDAATHTGIEEMRELTSGLAYQPLGGGVKVVIIDEFHALSKAAVQSFLKITEEPPPWVYWFMCTTEPARVLETIRTRCFQVVLKPVPARELATMLTWIVEEENPKLDESIVALCAEEANGSPRQALSNLAVCMEAKTEEEATKLLQTVGKDSAEAVELARLLIKRAGWREVQLVLGKLSEVSPETVRHVVRAYVTKVILGAKDERTAGTAMEILDAFSLPFHPSDGASPLVLACGKVVLS